MIKKIFFAAILSTMLITPAFSYTRYEVPAQNSRYIFDIYDQGETVNFLDESFTSTYNLTNNQMNALFDAAKKWTEYIKFDPNDLPIYKIYTSNELNASALSPYSRVTGEPYKYTLIDSMMTNKITVLRGPAGSGKSYLALSYLFTQLEKSKIDKIVIFCNTVAARGAAKLGFYPGDKNAKLLDSQMGNFLISKIGDRVGVERLIDDGTIVLLPMADIRGYDTTGMKAGIYITEAQNMDIELMRLALQRIGDDCICILDGDSDAQVDLSLYSGTNNGLRRVSAVFRGHEIYGEIELPNIYRSEIANIAQRL